MLSLKNIASKQLLYYTSSQRLFADLPEADEERGFVYPFPKKHLIIHEMKSSGPGGQNVNKRLTKITLKVNVVDSNWISDRTKGSLVASNELTKSGDILLYDESSRTQAQNKTECLNKLFHLLLKHSYVEPKPTPEAIAEELRRQKAFKGRKKESGRSKKFFKNRDRPDNW